MDLATGSLISHEHETSGTVRVIQHPDGSRQLALENLQTTNGPDVHVWLSAGPVVEGFDGSFKAGGHPYVDLGMIKGNQGNQLYDIPADVDLAAYPTVDLWCVQFSVSFGAAALTTHPDPCEHVDGVSGAHCGDDLGEAVAWRAELVEAHAEPVDHLRGMSRRARAAPGPRR